MGQWVGADNSFVRYDFGIKDSHRSVDSMRQTAFDSIIAMRCAIVLLALAAFGAAIPHQQQKQHAANQDLLKKQQDVILLLQQITEQIPDEQLHILGTTYDIQNNLQQYDNPILVKYYVGAVHAGLVQPRGTAYSSSISQLRKEVNLLQQILLGTKNYQTFLATAAWARVHVNEEQFVKAFVTVVLQHPETEGVILPPLYEIIPHSYFDTRIIQEVQNAVAQAPGQHPVIIPVNYTANLPHGEHQLSYFTQDVGLANYYAFVSLVGSLWPQNAQQQTPVQYQGVQHQEGQGTHFYFLHQQLLAHYELNRLANGLGPIQNTDYEHVEAPYQPHLRHINGLEFPSRPSHLQLNSIKNHLVHTVKKIEQRLMEAIDSGHVITPQGTFLSLYQPQGLNILAELIQGTGKSVNPRYYGSLQAAAHQLLGNAPKVQNIYDYTPSVLELKDVAVRDPAFYQLYKKVMHLFHQYQSSLPAYQYNDVVLPGVSIQNVQISPLVTLFNDYYVDLDSATVHQQFGQQVHHQQQVQHQQQQHQTVQQQQTQYQEQQQQHEVKAHLKRLDHKPYEYQITVQSEQSYPGAVVRVYLGPKFDYQGKPISISQHRHQFVELDQFITDLQQGENVIVRQSHQAPGHSYDYPSVQDIKHSVNGAVHAQEPFYVTEPQQIFGFPARLTLPKGQHQGFPVQLFVVISQPGQQSPSYGPVIPEQFQTYQPHQYEVVGTEQYLQQTQQQGNKGIGLKQTVEVVPEILPNNQQVNQVVRNHYADLYTKQHGRYPYTHTQYQVGQGQKWTQFYGEQGQWLQQGQHAQHVQGQQEYLGHQGQVHPQGQQQWNQWQGPHTTGVPTTGVHGVQGNVVGGIHTGVHGKYQATYQGQSQQQQGYGVKLTGSGQSHYGGFQNVFTQGQKPQDSHLNEYYQNKHISQIIGGAISLDGKPLGYPFNRPLSTGALSVPNVHVQTVYIYHEGQPTNEIYTQ